MYSVVLLAALTAGGNTPGWHHGYRGGYNCSGYNCYAGCWGGSYGGYGCWGGYGAYYGASCYGCWGGYGAYYGTHWGSNGGCYGCHGCYGCYGCYGCTGYSPMLMSAPMSAPAMPEIAPKPEMKKTTSTASPAKLLVEMPADAKLFVDDQPIPAEGRREFHTPALSQGQTYYYVVRAEVVREGKMVSDSKRVVFRAGEETRADFSALGKTEAVKKATPATESTAGR